MKRIFNFAVDKQLPNSRHQSLKALLEKTALPPRPVVDVMKKAA